MGTGSAAPKARPPHVMLAHRKGLLRGDAFVGWSYLVRRGLAAAPRSFGVQAEVGPCWRRSRRCCAAPLPPEPLCVMETTSSDISSTPTCRQTCHYYGE